MTTTGRAHRLPVTFLLLAAFALACDGSDGDGRAADAPPGPRPDTATHARTVGLIIESPWIRPAGRPPGSDEPGAPPVNSAAYLLLRNPGPEGDAIVGVATDVADTAELHHVTFDDEGIMRMRAVDSVSVPAGGAAVLEPGGYHVMLVGLRRDLAVGDTVAVEVRMRSGRVLEVRVGVRAGEG